MYNFCVLTGINYVSKALVMYDSLINCNLLFTLYYYCFDDKTYELILELRLRNIYYKAIIPVKIKDIENRELRIARTTRTIQEYFYTLTPFIILYSIKNFNLDFCTYVDADIVFYKSPEILFDEMGDSDVLLIRHNYSKEFAHLVYAGEYCVQFNPFKNNSNGNQILNWWKNRCLEWCYLRNENGRWGDQGYLDQFKNKFHSVSVSGFLGAGIAPWNIRKFDYKGKNYSGYELIDLISDQKFNLIFYHFQSVRIFFNFFFYLGGYKLPRQIIKELYRPYFKELVKITKELRKVGQDINPIGNSAKIQDIPFVLKSIIKNNIILVL